MSRRKSYPNRTARCLKRQPEFSCLDKSRPLFIFGFTFLTCLFVGAAIFYISTHVRMVDIGYKINQELNRKKNLIEENKMFRLEIARLKSPTRLEREATTRLGMEIPKAGQLIYLSQLGNSPKAVTLAHYIPSAPMETPPSPSIKTAPEKKKITAKKITPVKTSKQKTASVQEKTVAKASPRQEAPNGIPKVKYRPRKKGNIIIAKVIRGDSSPRVSQTKSSTRTKGSLKKKEALPAVVLDPMP